jgi:hypothetical protein
MNVALAYVCRFAVLSAPLLLGCSPAPEPGNPPLPPSALFPGYGSYATIESLRDQLPERSAWRVLFDSKSRPRRACPRFDELTFVITAEHLGHPGTLQLTFINERLQQTIFTPDQYNSYLAALSETGLHFTDRRTATIAPATGVWLSDPVFKESRFVGWRDERFSRQVGDWIVRCS